MAGNKAVFAFRKVTKEEVQMTVDNQESFGHDGISYGLLNKM